jgi:hypothetical protein
MTPRPIRGTAIAGLSGLLLVLLLGLAAGSVLAGGGGDPNLCDAPGDEPDVIVGSLAGKIRYGKVGDITGFSFGTISCNIGTCWLNWIAETSQHPVIAQNMYRLKDGRFEQIGQSWLKHGFAALSGELCSTNCIGDGSQNHLGVGCSDPYSANLNGLQSGLGPKFEVNATTGNFSYPFADQGLTGNEIYKRLQLHDADIDPALNVGAEYFAEAQYVARDDAGFGNGNNNASYRPVVFEDDNGDFDFSFAAITVRQEPAIAAWADNESGVTLVEVDVPDDGRFHVAAKATDRGDGTWSYEYAVHNLNSHRSAGSFTVSMSGSATVTDLGFHDVDYHSGEPYSGTDWAITTGATEITWATEDFNVEPNANALRWGTLYNFRFVADVPPEIGNVRLGMFSPGMPDVVDVAGVVVPQICDDDQVCEPGEACACPGDCGGPPPDNDFDTRSVCIDCDDFDSGIWASPGEVANLVLSRDVTDTVLDWDPPAEPGTVNNVTYEVLRSVDTPSDFVSNTDCVEPSHPTVNSAVDAVDPVPGQLFSYLVRATNGCGMGSLGADSSAAVRPGRACP